MACKCIATTDIYLIDGKETLVLKNSNGIIIAGADNPYTIRIYDADIFARKVNAEEYKYVRRLAPLQIDPETLNKVFTERVKSLAEDFNMLLNDQFPNWDLLFKKGKAKPEIKRIAEKYHMTTRHVNRLLKRFIFSCRDELSLIDMRVINNGHNKYSLYEQMAVIDSTCGIEESVAAKRALEDALRVYKKTLNAETAYTQLFYHDIFGYSVTNGEITDYYPNENCPSKSTFRRYLCERLGVNTLGDYVEKATKKGRDDRPMTATAHTGITRFGQRIEMDETELPAFIIQKLANGKKLIIGKPIMYVCADSFTNTIPRCYIGLDNNNRSGFCSLLASLLMPFTPDLERFGYGYMAGLFPPPFLPEAITVDHGSEFESRCIKHVTEEMKIRITFAPCASGSLKGLVENVHNRVQNSLREVIFDDGYIIPDKYRGADFAKKGAVCELEDIRELVYPIIADINQRLLPSRQPKLDQVISEMPITPIELYKNALENGHGPLTEVTPANRDRLAFSVLYHARTSNTKTWAAKHSERNNKDAIRYTIKTRKFRLTRAGIMYSGSLLRWISKDPWFIHLMEHAEREKDKIQIRYNENLIDYLYVCHEGKYHKVPLADKVDEHKDYLGMSFDEFDAYEILRKKTASEQRLKDLARRAGTRKILEEKVQEIRSSAGSERPYAKDIKVNRGLAKDMLRGDPNEPVNRMASGIGSSVDEDRDGRIAKGGTMLDTSGLDDLSLSASLSEEQINSFLDDRDARNEALANARADLEEYMLLPEKDRISSPDDYLHNRYIIHCQKLFVDPEEPVSVTAALDAYLNTQNMEEDHENTSF